MPALILKRYLNESVMIGDDVVVKVIEIRGGWVKLRVMAPIECEVDRDEVRAAKLREAGAAEGGGA